MIASKTTLFRYLKTVGIVNNGDNGRGFANPYDIAVSDDGRMFVLNRCDPARRKAIRVGVCNLHEEYLYEFGYGFGFYILCCPRSRSSRDYRVTS